MSKLIKKFTRLRASVGGDRQEHHYEETFYLTVQERNGITRPSYMNARIIAELDFAIKLSASMKGRFDSEIEKALDYLLSCIQSEGVLTNSDCLKAEEIMKSLGKYAKEYKLILAGHAHIDMNWMWSWQETVAVTIATFRTMLDIMDKYPQFCFSQSQTSVYKIIDDYAPEMKDRIKARIKEGRWEITSSAWVETDKNMPDTESLLNHIHYTKKYLKEKWDIDPDTLNIDFSPDTFGHSANVPEIDALGGVKYYYHCRALDGNYALYRWRGLSGKELLVYREQYWYNSGITPKTGIGLIDVSSRSGGLKTGLVVYGVGDHGGGPTRRDIESALDMQKWPIFPKIEFGTFGQFFKEAEKVRDKLPIVNGELNFIFPGCYTTQSRIKKGNRQSEALLNDAENTAAFALYKTGRKPVKAIMEKAWQDVLFTHFHDILTGSCVQDSREYAMSLFSNAIASGNTEFDSAARAIASDINTSVFANKSLPCSSRSLGGGVGYSTNVQGFKASVETVGGINRVYTLFNSSTAEKDECCEINLWDWEGNLSRLKVQDAEGNTVPYQILDASIDYWSHTLSKLLVHVKMPALSYTTLVLTEGDAPDNYPTHYQPQHRTSDPTNNFVLDNGIIRAEFDFMTGKPVSLKDVKAGEEFIDSTRDAGLICIDTERSSSNAWNIGRYLKLIPVTDAKNVRVSRSGILRNSVTAELVIKNSSVRVTYSLDKGSSALCISVHAEWNERATDIVPVLVYKLPLTYAPEKYIYNIPGGYIERNALEMDVPALSYAAAPDTREKCVAIITDSKYGFRGEKDGAIISTLINTTYSPDPYPEIGIHDINLYVGIFPTDPYALENAAINCNRKIATVSTGAHEGKLDLSGSLFTKETENVIVSSVTGLEDGSLKIRMYPVCEKDGSITLTFDKDVKSAQSVNIDGKVLSADIKVSGGKITVNIPHACIYELSVKF